MEKYFRKAKEENPVIDKTVVKEKLKFQIKERSSASNRFTYRHRVQLRLISVLGTILLVFLVGFLLRPNNDSNLDLGLGESPTTFWDLDVADSYDDNFIIQKTSLAKDHFLNTLAQDESDTAVVGIFFQDQKDFDLDMGQIPTLKLSYDLLEQLGFRIKNKTIVYEAAVKNRGYLKFIVEGKHHSVTVSDSPQGSTLKIQGLGFRPKDTDDNQKSVKQATFYPVYLSDMTGKQRVRFRFSEEDKDKMSQDYFNRLVDDLVPIAVPSSKDSDDYTAIFWFKSTKELFDALVEEPITPMVQGEDSRESPKEPSIETQKPIMRVNQNPFYDRLNITYSLPRNENAQIDLISIEGKPIKNLVSRKQHEASEFSKDFDLSIIPSGMYLLVMTTDSHRISQRILKQ